MDVCSVLLLHAPLLSLAMHDIRPSLDAAWLLPHLSHGQAGLTALRPPCCPLRQLISPHIGGRLLLGKKLRGFGEGYYNGFGGKVERGETIEASARREVSTQLPPPSTLASCAAGMLSALPQPAHGLRPHPAHNAPAAGLLAADPLPVFACLAWLQLLEEAGVRVSLANLRTFPCIRRKEREGTLRLRGAFFAIADGVLHLMDEATGEFHPAA